VQALAALRSIATLLSRTSRQLPGWPIARRSLRQQQAPWSGDGGSARRLQERTGPGTARSRAGPPMRPRPPMLPWQEWRRRHLIATGILRDFVDEGLTVTPVAPATVRAWNGTRSRAALERPSLSACRHMMAPCSTDEPIARPQSLPASLAHLNEPKVPPSFGGARGADPP
jgi:hypothetical protein